MTVKTLNYKDIGEVSFCKHKRAKYLKIALKQNGKIKVTMPYRVTFLQAYGFLESKYSWVRENIEKIRIKNLEKLVFTESTEFKTKFHHLKIVKYNGDVCKTILNKDVIEFFYPQSKQLSDELIQSAIKSSVIEAMRFEAKSYLPARLNEIAAKHFVKYNKVFIKNLKTRWGSCSGRNNINLNLHLMRLPEYLIDYVLYHELAHVEQKNHSKRFWDLLATYVPNPKIVDKELKEYKIELF